MAVRMVRGYGNWPGLRAEAKWYDLLTSEGSLTLAVGEHRAADVQCDRFTWPQKATPLARITNAAGVYDLTIQGNHRGDRYSGETWATYRIARVE